MGQLAALGLVSLPSCVPPADRSVTWTVTAPEVASVTARGLSEATLTGLSEGETSIFAAVNGSRADLHYYCCTPFTCTALLPTCQDVRIAALRVVR